MSVLAQVFGFIAIILWIFSVQEKESYKILLVQLISNIFFALQYLCLFALSGMVMYIIATVRCFIFYYYRKRKKTIPLHWLFLFIIVILISSIVTYQGLASIIPTIIVLSYTITTYLEDPKYIRFTFIIIPIIEIIYNFIVGAYVAIVGNTLEFSSGIISVVRHKNNYSEQDKYNRNN